MNTITKYMVDYFNHRGRRLEDIRQLAIMWEVTEGAVRSRLWRAGALPSPHQAMFWTDGQIAEAYKRLGSCMGVAEDLGVTFYVVKAALARLGITTRSRRKGTAAKKLNTYYYWKNRAQDDGRKPIEYVVGGRSNGSHLGTLRAASIQDAVAKAPGRALSRRVVRGLTSIGDRTRHAALAAQHSLVL